VVPTVKIELITATKRLSARENSNWTLSPDLCAWPCQRLIGDKCSIATSGNGAYDFECVPNSFAMPDCARGVLSGTALTIAEINCGGILQAVTVTIDSGAVHPRSRDEPGVQLDLREVTSCFALAYRGRDEPRIGVATRASAFMGNIVLRVEDFSEVRPGRGQRVVRDIHCLGS
jgi:hypothetical protein